MASTQSISVNPFPPARRSRWPRCPLGPALRSTSSPRLEATLGNPTREDKMTKIILSMYVAVFLLSFNARAQSTQDERQYAEGPVTLVQEIAVEYGHFENYIDWLNSTWKPTMEATKKAGIIIDYKIFSSTPPSPDRPNIILWITYKNMAALDRGVEEEEVAKKVIGSTEFQNKKRVERSAYRKVLRREYIRELMLK